MSDEKIAVDVGGRTMQVSNLDKVLYPAAGFTKAQVIEYYTGVADVLLPHIRGRAVTLRRAPNGVDGHVFFEKNVSRHAPDWVRTVRLPTPGSVRGNEHADYVRVEDLQTLVWTANLAALELHVPQWVAGDDAERHNPDLLVFDLDPGPGTSIVECCTVAGRIRALLAEDGLRAYPKTSGSKGLQLYGPIVADTPDAARGYAHTIAKRLAADDPGLVVSTMTRSARDGKILVDWSQNNPAKTTIAAYSLRIRERPTASTPLTWDEVDGCRAPEDLRFTAPDVLRRVDEHGDLFADLHDDPAALPR